MFVCQSKYFYISNLIHEPDEDEGLGEDALLHLWELLRVLTDGPRVLTQFPEHRLYTTTNITIVKLR